MRRQEDVNNRIVSLIWLLHWVFWEDTQKILWDTKLRLAVKRLKDVYWYKDIELYINEEYDEWKTIEILKILLDYKDYQALAKDEKK